MRSTVRYRCLDRGRATIGGMVSRRARPGRHAQAARVLSDHEPLVRRFALRVLGRR